MQSSPCRAIGKKFQPGYAKLSFIRVQSRLAGDSRYLALAAVESVATALSRRSRFL